MPLLVINSSRPLNAEEFKKVQGFIDSLPVKPATKETHVGVTLDCSGSMYQIKSDIIGAYNTFIDTLEGSQGENSEIFTTLVTFGEGHGPARVKYSHKTLSDLVKLTEDSYIPSGNTPMYDAIWYTIQELERYDVAGKDVAFLVNIFTDGYENASRFGRQAAVKEKIKALQARGNWTFTFTGANVDLDKIHAETAIPMGNMQAFFADSKGVMRMARQQVNSTASYMAARNEGMIAVNDFYNVKNTVDSEEKPAV